MKEIKKKTKRVSLRLNSDEIALVKKLANLTGQTEIAIYRKGLALVTEEYKELLDKVSIKSKYVTSATVEGSKIYLKLNFNESTHKAEVSTNGKEVILEIKGTKNEI